ncbi:MAG TPA: diguanylate cyclase [Terriglobales bacterium]|nr:diguanylate cyclase [Terriglobales bacterium]
MLTLVSPKQQMAAPADMQSMDGMRVLVAEDSQIYQRIVGRCLQDWGFVATVAKDGNEAWEVLRRPDAPKLLLLDWVLPDIDGIELCNRIRRAGAERSYSYIIVLTGKDGQADMLQAMEAGADDYIVKPFDEPALRARLSVGKRILDLHEELVRARESMRHAATHDWLTGVMNRGAAMQSLEMELERSRRDKKPLGVIMADIDHFKEVNDTCGHLYGDEALKEIAHRFRSKLRVYDTVGRYGGEEFLLILPGADLVNTMVRADELRVLVADRPIVASKISRKITVSMGVAVANGSGGTNAVSLLGMADRSLYAAKKNGRNRVEQNDDVPARSQH